MPTLHDKISLYFVKDAKDQPRLIRTELTPSTGGLAVATVKDDAAKTDKMAAHRTGTFDWEDPFSKARILALALVRAARLVTRENENDGERFFIFRAERISSEKRECTETRFYDLTTYKACDWLAGILHPSGNWRTGDDSARARFKKWFLFYDMRWHDSPNPPSIELNPAGLPPGNISIFLDGYPASPDVIDEIEGLMAAWFSSPFPPYFVFGRYKTAGFMPSVGASFGNRETEFAALDAFYLGNSAGIEIVGDSGHGKTALVRWWMRTALKNQLVREKVIFSWPFARQGRSDFTRQTLKPFFRSLANAVGAPIKDGMNARDLADLLLGHMREAGVFLFLDGIEALISDLGEYGIEGTKKDVSKDEEEVRLHYDSLVLLLKGLMERQSIRTTYFVITTRTSLKPIFREVEGEFSTVDLMPYAGYELEDPEFDRIAQAIMGRGDRDQRPPLSDNLHPDGNDPVSPRKKSVSQKIRHKVRRAVEPFALRPEECLLSVLSCFDEEADWDAVMGVLRPESWMERTRHRKLAKRSNPVTEQYFKQWSHLTEDEWQNALGNLVKNDLVLPTNGGVIGLHASVQQTVYEDFREHKSELCVEIHRRLVEFFANDPNVKLLPESTTEMEPLFRACWHGCNAGDFQGTFNDIAYSRMCRGWQAYVIFHLCEYEESLNILNLFTEDGETFPASDLHKDIRTNIKHGIALCLRYMDHLKDAYRQERVAWEDCQEKGHPMMGAIAANLLRLHHIHGDLGDEVVEVLWSLARSFLPRFASTVAREKVPGSMIPQALGYFSGIAALIHACRGSRQSARVVLKAAEKMSLLLFHPVKHLFPGMGVVHHALALLELGEWQRVLDAEKAGVFKQTPLARYEETGALFFVIGRALRMSSKDRGVQLKALDLIEKCRSRAGDNFRWWKASALLEMGRIKFNLSEMPGAVSCLKDALDTATDTKASFKLIEVDCLLGLAEVDATLGRRDAARELAEEALEKLKICGYEARRDQAERIIKFC